MIKRNKIGTAVFIILSSLLLFFPSAGIYFQFRKIWSTDNAIPILKNESGTGILIVNLIAEISAIVLVLFVCLQISILSQTFFELIRSKKNTENIKPETEIKKQ